MVQQVQAMIASQRRPVSRRLARIALAARAHGSGRGPCAAEPEAIEASLERIERESRRLDALVGEVLTLARLDSGVDDEAPQPTDLAALLATVVDDARFEGETTGVAVSCVAPETLPMRARADDLLRVFDNVVRNALRFAPAGSTVDIALKVSADGNAPL